MFITVCVYQLPINENLLLNLNHQFRSVKRARDELSHRLSCILPSHAHRILIVSLYTLGDFEYIRRCVSDASEMLRKCVPLKQIK